jgi:hypothetical protein
MNPRLIRLVASRYRELRGLATMTDAMVPLAFAALLAVLRSEWHVVPVVILAVLIAGVWAWFRVTWISEHIEVFYDVRCGRTGWRPAPFGHISLFMWGATTMAMGGTLMSWPPVARAAVVMWYLAVYPMFAVFRDTPYRLHWIVPLTVGVAAGVEYATLTSTGQAEAWTIRVLIAGGVSTALAGLGDHLLLTRTLSSTSHQRAVADPGTSPT